MSNQEAIALLRNLEDSLDAYCELNEEGKTAFRMAIEALSCSEFPNNSDSISRQAAIDAIRKIYDSVGILGEKWAVDKCQMAIKDLPSAEPEIKPIDYQDCANAMLRMWMDGVVTDGEYNRIMDKLNAFWRTRNEQSD